MQRSGFSAEGTLFAEFIRFLEDAADRGRRILYGPALDVYETERTAVVEVELPGWQKEQVSIQLADSILYLSGEPPAGARAEGRRYLRRERSTARLEEAVRLPEGGLLVDNIQATLKDGVLRVTVDKADPREGRRVNIG